MTDKPKSGGGAGSGPKPPTARDKTVRVKTARRRTNSSTRWLQRQLNDPYVKEAQRQGYRSRAAFKLIEMNDKLHLLKAGQIVVDLGAAPGGWCQVAIEKKAKKVIAIDLLDMPDIQGVDFIKLDFMDDTAPDRLMALAGGRVDLVLSDMAQNTMGHQQTDHIRIMALVEAAYDFAGSILKPNGAFVAKVFQGGTEAGLLGRMKRDFKTIKHIKPPASRKESAEQYVVAMGFRGEIKQA